jgi:chemotaxis protein MotB
MSGKRLSGDKPALIVIKRAEGDEGAHHGGAWKVAYADFMTAMMAFFLLMWLLNATTEEQKRGLADYFSPNASLIHTISGTNQMFGGHTPFDHGALVSDQGSMSVLPQKAIAPPEPVDTPADTSATKPNPLPHAGLERGQASGNAATAGPQNGPAAPGGGPALNQAAAPSSAPEAAQLLHAEQGGAEAVAFSRAAEEIRKAVLADPQLAVLANQLSVDVTPAGLRIQILDEDRQPMFASGSAIPLDRARELLRRIAPVLANLKEDIAITGHTDAAPYHNGQMSNWELSTERANATRRLLLAAGVQDARFRSITGDADRDLLLPADPLAAANRRISIVVLRSVPHN